MKKFLVFLIMLSAAAPVQAGGFLYKFDTGAPTSWENPNNIVLAPDSGACGDFSNAEMIDILSEIMGNFSDLDEVDLGFSIDEGQIGDITAENFYEAYTGGSNEDIDYSDYNPVIFDDTGEIFADNYGSCESIGVYLGFASILETNSNGNIARAAFVMNCACFREDHSDILCPGDVDPCDLEDDTFFFNENVLIATIQHEMGHFLNLDHTPLYGELLDDSDPLNDNDIPLMYPSLENVERDILPKQDDIVALATMYPSDSFESTYCEMTGTILDSSGSNQLQCAAISAINADPAESVSFVTGALAPAQDLNGDNDTVDYIASAGGFESTSARGQFSLYLKPGEVYEIQISSINPIFVDNMGVNPCKDEQVAACTEDILAACNDADEDTECEPCITDDALITSSEFISSYRDQCVAGESFDIGSLTAAATVSYETAIEANGGVTGDDDDDDAAAAACQLQTRATQSHPATQAGLILIGLPFFLLILPRRKCQ